MQNFQTFTPLNKAGKRRLKYKVYDCEIPRGAANAGRVFEVMTKKGKILRAMVTSCNLPECYCDARLI